MNSRNSGLSTAFIDKQRRHLMELRSMLRSAASSGLDDETSVNEDSANRPHEFEDDAQKLAALELDGNLVARDLQRLERVERALKKIDEGSYGLSDVSGQPIPQERLETVPEAICTLAEERESERTSARG